MMIRKANIKRKTTETDICLELNLNGNGIANINTNIGFLNHMLTLFARHGRFDIDLKCNGDIDVDYHHSVEDVGICLGRAFNEALGEKYGIVRYGYMILAMDEALILSAVDICERYNLSYIADIKSQKVGNFDTELIKEFWQAFASNCNISLHIRQIAGDNSHHIIEGMFKSVARSLKMAVKIDENYATEIPSTKGVI